jgi:hypothetical protein
MCAYGCKRIRSDGVKNWNWDQPINGKFDFSKEDSGSSLASYSASLDSSPGCAHIKKRFQGNSQRSVLIQSCQIHSLWHFNNLKLPYSLKLIMFFLIQCAKLPVLVQYKCDLKTIGSSKLRSLRKLVLCFLIHCAKLPWPNTSLNEAY